MRSGTSPETHYRGLSPRLAAKLRLVWSARGHDLDRIWGDCMATVPGITPLPDPRPAERTASPGTPSPDSAAHDQLCLFDQTLIWAMALRTAARAGTGLDGLALIPAQIAALEALTSRLVDTLSGLRMLVLAGLPIPALQLARSVSEDVDMVLALLLRRKLAQQFIACTCAEGANSFWRRHIAGGRAFRLVAEKLYEVGLDHSDQSDYGRWRRGVLTLLGSAVHSSALGLRAEDAAAPWPQNAALRDCLAFVTHRMQEFCAWSHVLDTGLQGDLARIRLARAAGMPPREVRLLGFAEGGAEILLDQMRWMLAEPDLPEEARR